MHHISEIQIVPIKPQDGLVGFASLVLDNSLHLSSIGIVTRPQGGYRLTYPTRKNQNGSFHIFYPINKKTAERIEQAVIARFEEVTKSYVRHHSTYTEQ